MGGGEGEEGEEGGGGESNLDIQAILTEVGEDEREAIGRMYSRCQQYHPFSLMRSHRAPNEPPVVEEYIAINTQYTYTVQ
jgi:hypothetical protein